MNIQTVSSGTDENSQDAGPGCKASAAEAYRGPSLKFGHGLGLDLSL